MKGECIATKDWFDLMVKEEYLLWYEKLENISWCCNSNGNLNFIRAKFQTNHITEEILNSITTNKLLCYNINGDMQHFSSEFKEYNLEWFIKG